MSREGFFETGSVQVNSLFYTMKYKMLLCLGSYRRPYWAAFQITRLLAIKQGYDISVSIKGVSEYEFRRAFFPQWKEELASGRLRIYFDSNKGQLSNFLDTLRRDYDRYDLFAKIDDDDFYLDRYFEELEEFYNTTEKLPWVSNSPRLSFFLQAGHGSLVTGEFHFPMASGPTLVLSRDFIRYITAYEKSCDHLRGIPPWEDAFMVEMAHLRQSLMHRVQDTVNFHSVMYNHMTASCMRGHYVPDDLKKIYHRNYGRFQDEERIIYAFHPHWRSSLRIFGERVTHSCDGKEGDVEFFDNKTLIVKWDEKGEEVFCKRENGAFYLEA